MFLMTPETFNRYLEDPSQLDTHTVDELWMLVKEYPYFQVARMLLARNLYSTGHDAYPLSLRLAAAYAGDRSKLKALIVGNPVGIISRPKKEILSNSPTELLQVINIDEGNAKDNEIPDVVERQEPGIRKVIYNPLIESIYSRLSEVQITESENSETSAQITEAIIAEKEQLILRNELVDKFIREEPRINAPKHEFYNPEDKARQSASLPEDFVTETLAKIYEQQGLYTMAVKIYEKLMLLIPGKSSYFAARINEIDNKRK